MLWFTHGSPAIAESSATAIGTALIIAAAAIALVERIVLGNFVFPLAIAWGLTAIAIKQSGNTPIVVAAAFGTVACLVTAGSIVTKLKDSTSEQL
jgi:hypothetical protein